MSIFHKAFIVVFVLAVPLMLSVVSLVFVAVIVADIFEKGSIDLFHALALVLNAGLPLGLCGLSRGLQGEKNLLTTYFLVHGCISYIFILDGIFTFRHLLEHPPNTDEILFSIYLAIPVMYAFYWVLPIWINTYKNANKALK